MSTITVTVFKHGLQLEADLSRLTRQFQKEDRTGYKNAVVRAEKELDYVAFKQITHSDSVELDLQTLGEHIAHGAPFHIERVN